MAVNVFPTLLLPIILNILCTSDSSAGVQDWFACWNKFYVHLTAKERKRQRQRQTDRLQEVLVTAEEVHKRTCLLWPPERVEDKLHLITILTPNSPAIRFMSLMGGITVLKFSAGP